MPGQGQGFDVDGARQAGYSDAEILQHLTQTRPNFDVNGALKEGYSQGDIINYLASTPAPNAQLPWLPKGVPTPSGAPGVQRPQVNVQPTTVFGGSQNGVNDTPLMPTKVPPSILHEQDPARGEFVGGLSLLGGGALAAAPAAAPAARFVAQQAAKHPIISGILGQQLIHQARRIPVVGPHIPGWAELLPFLMSSKGESGPAPVERDATAENSPFAGEEQAAPPQPQPTKLPWTPAQPTAQWPKPGSQADIDETRAIQEQVRNTADAENNALQRLGNQERYARSNKSELTGSENAPVKLTKTPSASTIKPKVGNSPPPKAPYYMSGGAQTTGNAPQGQSDDLTDILQKSLDQVKKRKGQQ